MSQTADAQLEQQRQQIFNKRLAVWQKMSDSRSRSTLAVVLAGDAAAAGYSPAFLYEALLPSTPGHMQQLEEAYLGFFQDSPQLPVVKKDMAYSRFLAMSAFNKGTVDDFLETHKVSPDSSSQIASLVCKAYPMDEGQEVERCFLSRFKGKDVLRARHSWWRNMHQLMLGRNEQREEFSLEFLRTAGDGFVNGALPFSTVLDSITQVCEHTLLTPDDALGTLDFVFSKNSVNRCMLDYWVAQKEFETLKNSSDNMRASIASMQYGYCYGRLVEALDSNVLPEGLPAFDASVNTRLVYHGYQGGLTFDSRWQVEPKLRLAQLDWQELGRLRTENPASVAPIEYIKALGYYAQALGRTERFGTTGDTWPEAEAFLKRSLTRQDDLIFLRAYTSELPQSRTSYQKAKDELKQRAPTVVAKLGAASLSAIGSGMAFCRRLLRNTPSRQDITQS